MTKENKVKKLWRIECHVASGAIDRSKIRDVSYSNPAADLTVQPRKRANEEVYYDNGYMLVDLWGNENLLLCVEELITKARTKFLLYHLAHPDIK